MLLQDRICVVTGAASARGLGRATARAMADQGARTVLLDIDGDDAGAAAADIGADHLGLACDVTDRSQCEAAAAQVLQRFGRIDVLFNNAGITQPLKVMDIRAPDYDAVLDVSLRGTLHMSQAVIPAMRQQQSGSIICMSSVSAERGGGIFGGPHYSAAKAGVLGLARAMARELGPDGIRVNAIAPGLIQTDITGGRLTDAMRARILQDVPMGRLGEAGDVAGVCVFLASDLAGYVTGATIDINGGSHIH